MRTAAHAFIVFAFSALSLFAHDIITTNLTYSRDISRIFARRCVACHGSGSSLPLTTYEEVRPWAVDIKEQVVSRSMPPWGAVKGFGNLSPDHALSQEEIMIVAGWVIGGAPAGDSAMLPRRQASISEVKPPETEPGLTIETRGVLQHALVVSALQPLAAGKVESARIIARMPNGRIAPLVWLYQFEPQSDQTFRFREPLNLPRNTIIESNAPLRFALLKDRVPAQ